MGAKRVGNGEEGIAGSSPLFQDLHPAQGYWRVDQPENLIDNPIPECEDKKTSSQRSAFSQNRNNIGSFPHRSALMAIFAES
jgi:hypothetical protein